MLLFRESSGRAGTSIGAITTLRLRKPSSPDGRKLVLAQERKNGSASFLQRFASDKLSDTVRSAVGGLRLGLWFSLMLLLALVSCSQPSTFLSLKTSALENELRIVVEGDLITFAEFYLDGDHLPFASDDREPFEATLDTSTISPGEHKVRVVVTVDVLGAASVLERTVEFVVDGSGVSSTPWQGASIGSASGNYVYSATDNTITLYSSGYDIWSNRDAFYYVYQPLEGDGQLIVRVDAVGNTNAWAKAGIMLRTSLDPAAAHASIVVTPGHGIHFQYRDESEGISQDQLGSSKSTPRWLKLVRNGNDLIGYESGDGSSWTQVGATTIALPHQAFIGLILTSHAGDVTNQAQFSNANLSGTTTPDPTPEPPSPPAPNPAPVHGRYLKNQAGEYVFLGGSHTWYIFQDADLDKIPDAGGSYNRNNPSFDYIAFLDELQALGHNFTRGWVWESPQGAPWTDHMVFWDPVPWQRSGTPGARDGGNQFDLTRFNQAFFDRARERVQAANARGITVSIMMFEGFSVGNKGQSGPNPWQFHPFNPQNNVNGLPDATNADGNGYAVHQGTTFSQWWGPYIEKWIDSLHDLDVIWEVANEITTDEAFIDWAVDKIRSYELSTYGNNHPVWVSASTGVTPSIAVRAGTDGADVVSPFSSWGSYHQNPAPSPEEPAYVLDTDHLSGCPASWLNTPASWTWQVFTRGYGGAILMEAWDGGIVICDGQIGSPEVLDTRTQMGQTVKWANRVTLQTMAPQNGLTSTGYTLADPASGQYIVFAPAGGTFTVDLSGSSGNLSATWFDIDRNVEVAGGTVVAGQRSQSFTAPFSGQAALLLLPQ